MANSRRQFLRLVFGSLGMTALSPALDLLGVNKPAFGLANPAISVVVTGGDKRFARGQSVNWTDAAAKDPANTITIDPATRFQSVLGFGGAFTDAACADINALSADRQNDLITQLFASADKGGLALNVCRSCIGSSDYSKTVYSFDEGEADPELKRFSIDHDKAYILPVIKKARAVNPDLFLFSSPWSPPGWMKSNKSMLGGNMQRKYMPAYAQYFVKFLQAYEAEGVPVQAVTVQNEVDTDQDGGMPACSWPQEYEADFVRHHLGPALAKNGMKTKIWLIDHNYNLWGRAIGELETPDVTKYASGIAWHGYVGDADKIQLVHKAFPEIDMFWTEGGPDYTDKHYGDNWTTWGKSFTSSLRNWCRSITAWNLALDENGKPNLGPFPCGGLVTINSKSGDVSLSGQYFAIGHFSKFVKRDAVRLDTQAKIEGVDHIAFKNPDGVMVVVLTNSGAERTVSLSLGGKSADITLAADSMATLTWA